MDRHSGIKEISPLLPTAQQGSCSQPADSHPAGSEMQRLSRYLEKYRIDLQTCAIAVITSIIVMIAEFGNSTFVSDLYHNQINNTFPRDSISADARFVPEFLFHTVFCGTYLPAIFLFMLVFSLVIGGLLMISRMSFLSGRTRVLPVLLLVLHPFLFAHSAYIANRLQTSCSIFFATLAAFALTGKRYRTIPRIGLSGILLSLSLMSFQPAVGIFLVCVLFLHADTLFERNLTLRETLRHLAIFASSIVLSMILYEACILFARHFWIKDEIRVHSMMALPATAADLQNHIVAIAKLLRRISFERTQFFPTPVKWLLLTNLAWLAVSIYRRAGNFRQGMWHIFFLVVCFLSFFFTMPFVYPIIPLPRIMPGLAFAWFFVFLFALKFGDRIARSFALFSVLACVIVFSVQFNIMHERLVVKNEIDKEITWQIVRQIQAVSGKNDEYQVVALVGTLSHRKMPYWPKFSGVFEGILHPDIVQSVYDYDWSKYRLLEFYFPCREPNETQWQEARTLAKDSPVWPAEGSVMKCNGFIAVVLSRP
jgi:hypothetical protein